jgi:hypothetical protein
MAAFAVTSPISILRRLGGLGEICRSDEGFHAIDEDALCVKAGSQPFTFS